MMKTLCEQEIERTFLNVIKYTYPKFMANSCFSWLIIRNSLFKIMNKTRMLTLGVSIPHCHVNPSQQSKGKNQHGERKGRIKTRCFMAHDCQYSTH